MMTEQIVNNPVLLDGMMADLALYDGPLGPGPYWIANQKATLNWLHENDLNRFREYDPMGKALANFGGGSLWRAFGAVKAEQSRLSQSLVHRASQKLRLMSVVQFYSRELRKRSNELSLQSLLTWYLVQLCRTRDADGDIDRVEASLVGATADAIDVGGREYTPKFLIEFLKYLDMKSYVDFGSVKTYVEIGPGVGLFAELLAKLHPDLRLYLIDIPPQLYVTQQVLQAIFPGEVATYDAIKSEPSILRSNARRIFILAPWQVDLIEEESVDLGFNHGFEEMRRETVVDYLAYFDKWRVKDVHIRSLDEHKTADGVVTADYAGFLPRHRLVARVPIRKATSPRPVDALDNKARGRPASAIYFKLDEDARRR